MKNSEMFDMDGCLVKNAQGVPMARLSEEGDLIIVKRLPACSLGFYFYILSYLKELGFEVK